MLRKSLLPIAFVVAAIAVGPAQAATPQLTLSTTGPSSGSVCALTQSGKVKCWGDNSKGQLASTAAGDGNGVATPQTVPLPRPAVQVAFGSIHACALLDDASVNCWGANYYGQLGNTTNIGTLNANPTPVPLSLSGPVSQLTAGHATTCLIFATGSVSCLGDNSFGQMGASPTGLYNSTPKAMALGSSTAKKVTIGGNFSCVLLTTLAAKCMGFNPSGQLANSTSLGSSTSTPVTANLGAPALDIVAGSSHACAILQNLTTWCWGENDVGQLGGGAADGSDHFNPVKASIGNPQSLALGSSHTCARLIAGGVDCWGMNAAGQLGVDDNLLTFNPNPSPLLSGFDGNATTLAAGGMTTCAIRADGTVQCTGDNSTDQFGVPRTDIAYSFVPVTVPGLNLLDAPGAAARLQLVMANPKLKYKKSGAKITASARAKVSGVGAAISTADCTGSATTRFERKVVSGSGKKRKTSYKKVVSKTANLGVKKGQCGLDLKLKVAKKYGGKKLYLRVTLKDGAGTTGFNTRFTKKVKRLKF